MFSYHLKTCSFLLVVVTCANPLIKARFILQSCAYYLDILNFNLKLISLAGDVPRVDGQLAVARAFGDRSLKKHLSSEPYVVEETIDENTDFLILASDGLWKVMHMKLLQTISEGFTVLPDSQHGLVYT